MMHLPKSPDAGVALVVAPHPDDEALACGGLIQSLTENGWSVSIVYLTDGRHSHRFAFGVLEDPAPQAMAVIRRREAYQAAACLGVCPSGCIS